ncbi:MAG: cob(I)yrinic acid a,c-diamide adenosyltransferase [Acidobacteria bacterium]|nr:cob(I)yrinic acid a,c-diamide adenosyltransferase [Acidobacteriota bacterium]
MRLTRLYTRDGDDGETRLADGTRVAKDSPRVVAYGAVDELNSVLGVALTHDLDARVAGAVQRIQNELFDLGGDLATPRESDPGFEVPRLDDASVTHLEPLIDELNSATGPLENFILPGGAPGAATLQVARTVCRRAERHAVTLAREADTGVAVAYLNRLSDLLFAMARYENQCKGESEPLWEPGANR